MHIDCMGLTLYLGVLLDLKHSTSTRKMGATLLNNALACLHGIMCNLLFVRVNPESSKWHWSSRAEVNIYQAYFLLHIRHAWPLFAGRLPLQQVQGTIAHPLRS